MKDFSFRVSVAVTVLALACLAGVVFSQIAAPPTGAEQKLDHVIAPAEAPQRAQQLPNLIKFASGDDETHLAVATALSVQAAPRSRTDYFAAILNDPQCRLSRWCLEVFEIRDSDGKTVVKVRAAPQIAARVSATVVGALDETYERQQGSLKLSKTEVPPGSQGGVGLILD